MKPIISPWSIYFADVLPSLGHTSFVIGIVATIAFLAVLIFWGMTSLEGSLEDEEAKSVRKVAFKVCLPILLAGYLISILTPSKKTIYTMMVVNQITPHNIEILGDSAKDVVDYITDEIKELTKEEKETEEK